MSSITKEIDFSTFPTGKREHVADPRTIRLRAFFVPNLFIPEIFDFDKYRAKFPLTAWGNTEWGDCVIAGEANHLQRLERIEQRWTVPISDADAVEHYKAMSLLQFGHAPEEPGDQYDQGLVVLYNLRDWKNNGWTLPGRSGVRNTRSYQIAAYGELDPDDPAQLRSAIYLLHGAQFGFSLPRAAQEMTNDGVWDYNGQTGPEWQPGSWGGHLVFSKAYDHETIEVLTWGLKVRVTNAFIERYADEAWAVVDTFNSWRVKHTINVPELMKKLYSITDKVDQ